MTHDEPRPSLAPVIIGISLAAFTLLGLGLWVSQRDPRPTHPSITLISPAADTVSADSITLVFETSVPLTLQPTGWGAGRYHLHAVAGNVELMPGAAQIKPISGNRYNWTIPPVASATPIQLMWSLPNHRRLSQGASHQVTVSRP